MARNRLYPGSNTALVTGGSSGIGLYFCRHLAAMGCGLVLVSNQEKELSSAALELSNKYNVPVATFFCDLSDADAAQRVVRFLDEQNIEIDYLINNAGIFSFLPIIDTQPDRLSTFIELHMRTTTMLCRLIGERMKARRRGRILNMSSMSCWMPMPGIAMYSATKAYIRVFSRALNYELHDYSVSVTVACPGGIATGLFGLPENLLQFAVKIGVLDTPQNFTKKALNRMFKAKKQYINGFLNRLSIFFVGIAPTCLRMAVKHKLLDKQIIKA